MHSILDSSILRAKSSRQGMAPQKVYSSTTHATRCAGQWECMYVLVVQGPSGRTWLFHIISRSSLLPYLGKRLLSAVLPVLSCLSLPSHYLLLLFVVSRSEIHFSTFKQQSASVYRHP